MRPDWRRHQLAWLHEAGWQRACASAGPDAVLQEALAHWRAAALPWVVTRQSRGALPDDDAGDGVALGLPLPARWAHRRLAVVVPVAGVAALGSFPTTRDVTPLVAAPRRAAWQWLCDALDGLGADARVHGSHGWQALTGLDHLTPRSDLDLHVEVDAAPMADRVAAVLATASGLAVDGDTGRPWLDGELVFPDGAAVAWREWRAARRADPGSAQQVLVKRLGGVALEDPSRLGLAAFADGAAGVRGAG